jgi:hypothetical protein
MFPIIALLAAAPPPPLPPVSEARAVIEWQLRAPPRTGSEAALSPEEAAAIQQRYLQSIGQRPEKPQDRLDQ